MKDTGQDEELEDDDDGAEKCKPTDVKALFIWFEELQNWRYKRGLVRT